MRSKKDGSDRQKSCADNQLAKRLGLERDGSNRQKSCVDNAHLLYQGYSDGGGDKPKRVIEITFGWKWNLFIVDSEGRMKEHPNYYEKDMPRLAYLNQKCARRLKWICKDCGHEDDKYLTIKKRKVCVECKSRNIYKYLSKNWKKANYTLEKFYEHLNNKRDNFIWTEVRYYVENYNVIIVNKWPLKMAIEYCMENKTARNLVDGAYGKFVEKLRFKCKELGIEFIERKDLLWQQEVNKAMEVKEIEQMKILIQKSRKLIRWPSQGHLESLNQELRRQVI